jgi:hypothetical protein
MVGQWANWARWSHVLARFGPKRRVGEFARLIGGSSLFVLGVRAEPEPGHRGF